MKPNPLELLNHLKIPLLITIPLQIGLFSAAWDSTSETIERPEYDLHFNCFSSEDSPKFPPMPSPETDFRQENARKVGY